MPRFLAVYTVKPEDLARFRSLPKSEQDAIDAVGLKHSASVAEAVAGGEGEYFTIVGCRVDGGFAPPFRSLVGLVPDPKSCRSA